MLNKPIVFKTLFVPADSKQSYAVYRFVISINPSDIAELDATLGNYILHNPIKAAEIFQSVSVYLWSEMTKIHLFIF